MIDLEAKWLWFLFILPVSRDSEEIWMTQAVEVQIQIKQLHVERTSHTAVILPYLSCRRSLIHLFLMLQMASSFTSRPPLSSRSSAFGVVMFVTDSPSLIPFLSSNDRAAGLWLPSSNIAGVRGASIPQTSSSSPRWVPWRLTRKERIRQNCRWPSRCELRYLVFEKLSLS